MKESGQIHAKPKRLYYIENLRIVLSALVIAVHVACSYGGPGGWGYKERGAGLETILPLTIFNATSQAFFMGLFFFISAYFTHLSFQRKGFRKFATERLIRLGIPLAITFFLISTLSAYLTWPIRNPKLADLSYFDILITGNAFSFGVMWFVLALCYFTVLYLIARLIIKRLRQRQTQKPLTLTASHVLTAALTIGILSYLVRIKYPLFTGPSSTWLHFTLGHFPQYVFLFYFGIFAAHFKSEIRISKKQANNWMTFSIILVFVVFPLIFFLGKVHVNGVKPFLGNGTIQSLAYAVWEQLTGLSIMVAIMGIFKERWNIQGRLSKKLADSSYAAYVLHPPILYGISILFRHWETILLIKFAAISPLAILASFGVAVVVKRIPVLKRIF